MASILARAIGSALYLPDLPLMSGLPLICAIDHNVIVPYCRAK